MAFLDNSGDIILDAVLTDLGRKRLAAGNFRISKFALGDEEVNYNLFNATDARGSAFYDLEIMQTPVLEAFTSDQSLMKTRLLSFARNDLLYMPVLKINNKPLNSTNVPSDAISGFHVISDSETFSSGSGNGAFADGFIYGMMNQGDTTTTHICIDQGIDSGDDGLNVTQQLDPSLLETAFIVKVDHRLLRLQAFSSESNFTDLTNQFIDDDAIATYYIIQGQNGSPILGPREPSLRKRNDINPGNDSNERTGIEEREMFAGPLGNVLRIVPRVSNSVQQSTSLFTELGSTGTNLTVRTGAPALASYKYIDTVMNVTGVTTGYSIDVPIRIIKQS
jgi:hypothetical protein